MANTSVVLDLAVPEGIQLKKIPNLDSALYRAGSDGHIYCYSIARVNARKPHPFRLRESIGDNGYPFVSIIKDGRKMSAIVHTLVCSAFHGVKPSPTHEVCHYDGDKLNSLPSNLRWGTPAENEADKKRHGRVACGSRHGIAKLNEEAVRILRIAIPAGLWNPIDAGRVFGVDPSVIRAAVSHKSWKHVETVPGESDGKKEN